MTPLSGLDGSFLSLETPETPMHVGSLHLFEVPRGKIETFYPLLKRSIAARLDVLPVFRRRLAPMPLQFANPVWIEEGEVDLDHHIRRVVLPKPGTREQLYRAAADLHATLLDRRYPLWMIYVFEGLESGEVGYYIKVHHAALDGQAGIALAQTLFDPQPSEGPTALAGARHAVGSEHPGVRQLAAAAFRHDSAQLVKLVRQLPEVVRTLSGMLRASGARPATGTGKGAASNRLQLAPRTPLNVSVGPEREFSALSIPLEEVRRIAAAHEAKVNDVVMAICSGGLRRYLADRGGIPGKPLLASMPVSLRAPGDKAEYTTQVTMALVSLASDIADPIRRLKAIRDAAGAVKSTIGRARSIIPTDFPSIGLPWVMHGLASLYGKSHIADAMPPVSNVVISNVPGPRLPLYSGPARMTSYWPLSIVEHGVGLNITLISYAGNVGFGLIAARNAVPDLGRLTDALAASFEELKRLSLPEATRQAPKRGRGTTPRPSSKGGAKTPTADVDKVKYAGKGAAARKPAGATGTTRRVSRPASR